MQVYLNGNYLPVDEAKISPLDRGFLFGDAVYEVIPVFARKPFEPGAHLQRLQRSLDAIGLKNPHTNSAWKKIIMRIVQKAEQDDQALYIQVSRGQYPTREHLLPSKAIPTVFIAPFAMKRPTKKQVEKGLSVVTAEDNRWQNCHIKATSLLANVLLRNLARLEQADETVLFRDGFLTEASSANIFVVIDGELLVVPADQSILRGIVYEVIIRLARKHKLKHSIRSITKAEVMDADELWISSSTRMLLPITTIDARPVGHGKGAGRPGVIFKKMYQLLWQYQEFKA